MPITESDLTSCIPAAKRIARKFNIPGHDTADLVQEAMLYLHAIATAANEGHREITDWPGYAKQMIRYRIRDLLRGAKAKRRGGESRTVGSVEPSESISAELGGAATVERQAALEFSDGLKMAPDPSPGPLDAAIAKEEAELLHEAIESLPDYWKAPLDMHMRGFPNRDIGKLLGISHTAAAMKINRAKAELRKILTLKGVR
jgi:RNA polymerase sigma factor (sigma-70 family)